MDWPSGMPDWQCDLYLAKHWREPACLASNMRDPEYHMSKAISALFTREQFTPNRWSDLIIYDWCHRDFFTVIGAGATTKSNTIGVLCLLDYITDPKETLILLVSTTRQMLEIRSYESVIRHFGYLKAAGPLGLTLNRQRMAILNEEEAGLASAEVKAAIRGVAVKQGTVEEAKSNLQGAHLPYVRLVIDELQQTRPAAVEARHNLSLGVTDFKFVGLANPDSQFDLSGQMSKPKDPRGWGAVSVDDEQWESVYGHVIHLDGMKSPAITEEDGALKYPFLIKQTDIDRVLQQNHGNWDAPSVWTMIRGFPPPQGLKNTILTESAIRKYKMQDQPIWMSQYTTYAALDPAFTTGGDGCVLQVFRVGTFDSGLSGIAFEPPIYLKIEASSELPVQYQIAAQVETYGYQYGFMPDRMVVDETGTQRVSDVIETNWGPGITRFVGSTRPTELPVSAKDLTPASKKYRNHITEAYYAVAEFGQYDQIRGLCDDAARQFTMREIVPGPTVQMEPKDKFKLRLHASPDEADPVAMAVQFARERLGIVPGASIHGSVSGRYAGFGGINNPFSIESAREIDLDSRENAYLVSDM